LKKKSQFVGFAVIPGAGVLLHFKEFYVGGLLITSFNIPGFLLAFMNLLAFFCVMFLPPAVSPSKYELEHVHHETSNPQSPIQSHENSNSNLSSLESYKNTNSIPPLSTIQIQSPSPTIQERNQNSASVADPELSENRVYFYTGVSLFLFLNFIVRGVLSVLETAGSSIYSDILDFEKEEAISGNSLVYLILGMIGLVVFLLIDRLRKLVHEITLLSVSLLFLAAGSLLLIEFGTELTLWQFLIGALLQYK
jgi:hypothetical protein